ncbi:FeS cluster assembly protein SufD [Arsenophonus endosymbiont of Aleurodicus dispersus]|uniref:Fe-S cluster assembly protein SufD n=1 Tax=Arsenophonus endosymbiont of Aleurodicus dispersus TaxID=235559 RepID=UPI000EADDF71|nr:Fe-S cluster assembly protein SufD [Arsenophonus endosymbiont of Aleurodicus dispersus]VAY02287.1 FeS cluster assembly protein SufD [Arsenophonus endosymbiont of Aleurodicus dispersus]
MAGLLTKSYRAEKQHQVTKLNQQALKVFKTIFHGSKRAKEKQAKAYWEKAEKIGFPPFGHEDWHYTPLAKVLNTQYQLNNDKVNTITADKLKQLAIYLDGWNIIFLNGYFIPALSSNNFNPYQIQMMDTLAQEFPGPIVNDEIFLYLTESLAAQPLFIKLADNQQVEKPLYILNITSGLNHGDYVNTSHYRYHLAIGANCKSQVIEHFISIDDKPHLTGSRLTANIGDNSYFSHIKLSVENNQSSHFAHNDILSGTDCQITSSGIFIGSALFRHHTNVKLNGAGSRLALNSLLLPQNRQIVDTRTYIEHNKPFCESRQLHKTIAQDASKSIFNGMIKVAPAALKTDGKMINNNLLLGKQSEIYTKPQLEIYADDVKCSHGATVGCIDDEQLFYLRSRGININNSKYMIMVAFADEVIKAIDSEGISNKVMNIIQQRLARV